VGDANSRKALRMRNFFNLCFDFRFVSLLAIPASIRDFLNLGQPVPLTTGNVHLLYTEPSASMVFGGSFEQAKA
jgi:hypothetical protein